jgi:hypothetical protein
VLQLSTVEFLKILPQVVPKLPLLGGCGPRLSAATRTTLVADFNDPSWPGVLLSSGFDPARPTVWVAEGLLYYLEPAAAEGVLKVTRLP